MPPLKQPKTLLYLSQTAFSSWYSLALFRSSHLLKLDLFDILPHNCAEELSYFILQAAFGVIHHNCANCDQDLDDAVLIAESCHYLNSVLQRLLNVKSKYIDVSFDIDMRSFANFKFTLNDENEQEPLREVPPEGLMVTEEFVTDNQSIFVISQTIDDFLQSLPSHCQLQVFNPGLYIIDRQSPNDDFNDPHKISLCWNRPQLLISLVDQATKLTSLNLLGYEELTDLGLEYIAGKVGNSNHGLKLLNEITLPKKCFVTSEGLRVLIENLPCLELIENQGKMGVMLQVQHLQLPEGQCHFKLKEFTQMESMTSGGLEENEEVQSEGEVTCWNPREEDIIHLHEVCPDIKSFKILMSDKELFQLASNIAEHCYSWDIHNLDVHLVNPDFVSLGINRLCATVANNLVSLKLTVLDHITWHSILIIGELCQELKIFHMDVWDRLVYTNEDQVMYEKSLQLQAFQKLEDLKIKCEDYTDPLPDFMISFFLQSNHIHLKNAQIIAHLSWLTDSKLQDIMSFSNATSIEMLIIHNIDSSNNMPLSMDSVNWLIQQAPQLTILGNLRSWSRIDYYDRESPHFYKSESQLSQLKKAIQQRNWDLDLDIENLDHLYT